MTLAPPAPPILLAAADYHGTLAAARALGRAGVPVEIAESRWLVAGRWSRYVSVHRDAPGLEQPAAFMQWLLALGEKQPGRALYATSDETAFLYALHREELSRHFCLYQPPIETMYTLLNKHRLRAEAAAVGIDTPQTWLPSAAGDLSHVPDEIRFPVLIKPQTQILYFPHPKGAVVRDRASLPQAYAAFVARARHAEALLRFDPEARRPLLQAFFPQAANGIYNVAGFIDESGELFLARASRKVLQRPRRLGVGICFEWAPLKGDIAARVAALCRRVGYHGVFEVELVEEGDRLLLLDFNPRFYGEMGFELARGLPLAQCAYLAALGRRDELRRAVESARAAADGPARMYVNRFQLEVQLRAQRLAGRISRAEAKGWRERLRAMDGEVVDAVMDADDWRPALVEFAAQLYSYARHPRAFLHQVVLDA